MPEGLTAILDTEGSILPGKKAPDIPEKKITRLYRVMVLNRLVDERMTRLQRQGRIGFYIGSIGEEASILGSAFALREDDWVVPCYRELGAALLRGFPLFDLCCQLFGNAQDHIQGRQMPNHYASRELRFASISSPVGTQIPHATGLGLAARLKGTGEVALVYFGDGATSQGDFHTALNFAAVYKTSTIFLCRNNQWAISVPLREQTASKNLAIKGVAYGIEGIRVDGNDILATYEVTRQAVEKARAGDGPTLIEAVTYRMGAHSTSDDPRVYRDEFDVELWKERDPLRRFKTYLIRSGFWDEERDEQLYSTLDQDIQKTLREAEKIGPPPLKSVFEDVLDEMPWHLREQYESVRDLVPTDHLHEAVES